MKVRWTREAEQDRDDVWEYIARDNPLEAIAMDELFSEAVAKLADYPLLGRAGQISGTRELIPHESYRIIYEVSDETVWVLALLSTARQWPPATR